MKNYTRTHFNRHKFSTKRCTQLSLDFFPRTFWVKIASALYISSWKLFIDHTLFEIMNVSKIILKLHGYSMSTIMYTVIILHSEIQRIKTTATEIWVFHRTVIVFCCFLVNTWTNLILILTIICFFNLHWTLLFNCC